MDKLTEKAFWQQWPKTAKRFRRAGAGAVLRDAEGYCPIVGVARDLRVTVHPDFSGTKLAWWGFVDEDKWAQRVAMASDTGWQFVTLWQFLKLAWRVPRG